MQAQSGVMGLQRRKTTLSFRAMNTPHTHIWCDQCQTIRPVVIVDMHADDASGAYTDASDLRCDFCSFVIATLYLPKPKTQAIEALQRKA